MIFKNYIFLISAFLTSVSAMPTPAPEPVEGTFDKVMESAAIAMGDSLDTHGTSYKDIKESFKAATKAGARTYSNS
jgi:hypothetical protein